MESNTPALRNQGILSKVKGKTAAGMAAASALLMTANFALADVAADTAAMFSEVSVDTVSGHLKTLYIAFIAIAVLGLAYAYVIKGVHAGKRA